MLSASAPIRLKRLSAAMASSLPISLRSVSGSAAGSAARVDTGRASGAKKASTSRSGPDAGHSATAASTETCHVLAMLVG